MFTSPSATIFNRNNDFTPENSLVFKTNLYLQKIKYYYLNRRLIFDCIIFVCNLIETISLLISICITLLASMYLKHIKSIGQHDS